MVARSFFVCFCRFFPTKLISLCRLFRLEPKPKKSTRLFPLPYSLRRVYIYVRVWKPTETDRFFRQRNEKTYRVIFVSCPRYVATVFAVGCNFVPASAVWSSSRRYSKKRSWHDRIVTWYRRPRHTHRTLGNGDYSHDFARKPTEKVFGSAFILASISYFETDRSQNRYFMTEPNKKRKNEKNGPSHFHFRLTTLTSHRTTALGIQALILFSVMAADIDCVRLSRACAMFPTILDHNLGTTPV